MSNDIDDDDAINNIYSSSVKLLPGNKDEDEDVEFESTIGVLDALKDMDQKEREIDSDSSDEEDYIGKPPKNKKKKKRKKEKRKKKKKDDEEKDEAVVVGESFVAAARSTLVTSNHRSQRRRVGGDMRSGQSMAASRSTSLFGLSFDADSDSDNDGWISKKPQPSAKVKPEEKKKKKKKKSDPLQVYQDDGSTRRETMRSGSKEDPRSLHISEWKNRKALDDLSNTAAAYPSSKQAAASKGAIVEAKRQRPKNNRSTGSLVVDSRSTGSTPLDAASSSFLKPISSKKRDSKGNGADRKSKRRRETMTSTGLNSKPRSSDKPASKPGKSSEEEKYGIVGPFAHLYDKDLIERIQKFILGLADLHNSIKDTKANHFDGLYPIVPYEKLEDVATITGIISRAHPSFFEMVMKKGFNATAIPKKTLRAIETATINDGKIAKEYQVDSESLPKRHCGKDIIPQKDASKFANSCSGAYVMGFEGTFLEFKTRATSWLRLDRNESKGDKRLNAFLQAALSRHKSLGTHDDAIISVLYPGTTSRSFILRWAEHDSKQSDSLNSAFRQVFPKTFQFGVMFSPPGDIGSSLMVEAFLAGVLQLATTQTLRIEDPNAVFSFQAYDGTSLTRTNGGVYMGSKGSNDDVGRFLSTMIKQKGGDTRLSALKYLPSYVRESIERHMDAMLSYMSSDMVRSNGKRNNTFEKRFGCILKTPAEVLSKATLDMLRSFYQHIAGMSGYDGLVANTLAANPELTREQAKRLIADTHGQGKKDYLDKKFNRKSNVIFPCLICAKKNVLTHRLFPANADDVFTKGIQKGRLRINHTYGNARCPNEDCNGQHPHWGAVTEKADVAAVKAGIIPNWIQSLCRDDMCVKDNCVSVRFRRRGKYVSDKCQTHHLGRSS